MSSLEELDRASTRAMLYIKRISLSSPPSELAPFKLAPSFLLAK